MRTPVAFIIFNRPDTTARVFAEIARARPPKLLVVADGPRAERPDEAELCRAARSVVARIDWDCEVLTNFSDVNLGCRDRVASGLTWVFEQVEEAIILEDDCLPDPTFFPFCEELLERYRTDERVAMICGSNFQQGHPRSPYSYFFVRHTTVWGWATWRRAWAHFGAGMETWRELRETSWLDDLLVNPVAAKYWREVFDAVHDRVGEVGENWDYPFFFTWWARHALAVSPEINLVSNIGFGPGAAHTREVIDTMAALPTRELRFPLRHPPYMRLDRAADNFAFRQICPWLIEHQSLYWRLRGRLTGALPQPVRESVKRWRARLGSSR